MEMSVERGNCIFATLNYYTKYNCLRQDKDCNKQMKKLIMTIAVFATLLGGTMLFSSFTTAKEQKKADTTNVNVTDDGWENWTRVSIYPYERKNGQWVKSSKSSPGFSECQVQRREWCGEKEYRIQLWERWYPVTSSPIDDYRYAFYGPNGYAYCFNM